MSDLPLPYQSPPAAGKNLFDYIEEEHAILAQNLEALLSLGDSINKPVGVELNARLGCDEPIVEYIKLMKLKSDLPIEVLTERRLEMGLIVGKEIEKHWLWAKQMAKVNAAIEQVSQKVSSCHTEADVLKLCMEAFTNPSRKNTGIPPPPPPQPILARPPSPEPSKAEPASPEPAEAKPVSSKPAEAEPEPPKPFETTTITAEVPDDASIDENANQKTFLDMLARDFERRIYVLKLQEKDKIKQLNSYDTGSSYVFPTTGFTSQELPLSSSCAMVDRQAEVYTHVRNELYEIRRQLKLATLQVKEVAKRKRDLSS